MSIKQISVFLKNRSGRLSEVTRALANAKINIRAISIADTADFGILRLIVSDPDLAVSALEKAGLTTKETEVLAVEVSDNPGSLADLMDLFKDKEVNIEYLYASLQSGYDKATIFFKLEDLEKGARIVREHGLKQIDSF